MATGREIIKIVGLAGLALLIGQGCSQKSVRTTADSETFEQGAQYADNQAGADNPFAQGYKPFGSWQGNNGQFQPGGSQPGGAQDGSGAFFHGAQGAQPEGPAQAFIDGVPQGHAQAGNQDGSQSSSQQGLKYFGAGGNQSGSWQNGPLAGLQEYGGNNRGWSSGQGGSMAEEFIQQDYDGIAEAQPFSSPGFGQGGQFGPGGPQGQGGHGDQFARVQVELQDVFFEFDSWRISQEGMQSLAHDADWLAQNQNRSLTVEGHCDQRGTRDYNLVLGKKRAQAVRTYLVDLGVEAHKIQVISYGKERPFCFGNDEQCYQLNRRGHLQLHQ